MSDDTLVCDRLGKSFNRVIALDSLSLRLPQSGIAAIIGPNGAGKTTLLNIITGFIHPDSGQCTLGRCNITRRSPYEIAMRGITRTFQDLRLVRLISVLENVMLARPNQHGECLWHALGRLGVKKEERRNRAEAERLLDFVGLSHKALEPAGELSYGQQKLLTLACCLATEARILLLDEPIAGVHPEMAERILDLLGWLRERGKLIVFVEHDMGSVRKAADVVYVMDDGKLLAQGPPDEVLDRPEIMEAFVA